MELTKKVLDRIARMCLLDDGFMKKVFEDKACAELLLRIILDKPDLMVETVQTELLLKNLQGRDVRLDVYASDAQGKQYNIEVQRKNYGATPKRARYNSSLLDANITNPGDDYKQLPESYMIFITEHDVFRQDKQLYHFERICPEINMFLNDSSHIIYVNASKHTDTALGRLMQDFGCVRASDMYFDILADRVRYFKENQEGMKTMCRIWEEFVEDGRAEGRAQGIAQGRAEGRAEGEANMAKETAKRMLEDGEPVEKIIRYTNLTLEQIDELRSK